MEGTGEVRSKLECLYFYYKLRSCLEASTLLYYMVGDSRVSISKYRRSLLSKIMKNNKSIVSHKNEEKQKDNCLSHGSKCLNRLELVKA